MSKVFAARFSIIGSGPLVTPGDFEVFGHVIDQSLDGYYVGDVAANDIFFDENILTGQHNRFKVLSVVATGSGAFGGANSSSIHLYARWDDQDVYDPNGPAGCEGIICKPTPLGISELPAWTIQGVSEGIIARARNIDMRYVIDPALNHITKIKYNGSLALIPAFKPVALKSDGTIVLADADGLNTQVLIGFTLESIDVGNKGKVLLTATNAPGVLIGLGFAPNETILLSKTPGVLTNDFNSFDINTDTIMKVGIADCANDTQSSVATDLIMMTEVLSQP